MASWLDARRDRELLAARDGEFGHLNGVTYLDHAGATLYSASQLRDHFADLSSHLYGNPHSQNPGSQLSGSAIDHARQQVLEHFNASSSDYDVVFTCGCTAALKLLSESFPWTSGCGIDGRLTGAAGGRLHAALDSAAVSSGTAGSRPARLLADSQSGGGGGSTSAGAGVLYTHCVGDGDGQSGDSRAGNHGSVFCYLEDNHTSVVGMREEAIRRGARVVCATEHEIVSLEHDPQTHGSQTHGSQTHDPQTGDSIYPAGKDAGDSRLDLFAFPAQSNFSGRKYPLSWITDFPSGKVGVAPLGHAGGSWTVLLDAASYVSTSALDLSDCPAHFVAISFYKMFGFPTGLGALLVRADCAPLLHKSYYGGGTVAATISRQLFHVPRQQLHDRLEDGTLPFLDIVALSHGFAALHKLGGPMEAISMHTFSLARYVHHSLSVLTHGNGKPVSVLYCDSNFEDPSTQGPIVNFNLLRSDGSYVGYSEVDNLACVHDIHLRTGCFCNTGACMSHLGLTSERVIQNIEAGHECGDNVDIVGGRPTGSVRVSFGYMSIFEDAEKFVNFIKNCFVDACTSPDLTSNTVGPVASIPEPPILELDSEGKVDCEVDTSTKAAISSTLVGQKTPHPPSPQLVMTLPHREREANSPSVELEKTSLSCSFPECAEDGGHRRLLREGDHFEVTRRAQEGGTLCQGSVMLEAISLYPVKSCAAFRVSSWPIGSKGFLYDREWMVLSQHGSCLSQKQEPRLCLIKPFMDLQRRRLTLKTQDLPALSIQLSTEEEQPEHRELSSSLTANACLTRVCGDKVRSLDCGDEAARWLGRVLQRPCRLVRQHPAQHRRARNSQAEGSAGVVSLSLVNEAQFLLIARPSVKQLQAEMRKRQHGDCVIPVDELLERFRPNLIISGDTPYSEDDWVELQCKNQPIIFKVTGHCSRCRMICVDQASGERTAEPLQTLLSLRGNGATFGIYLSSC